MARLFVNLLPIDVENPFDVQYTTIGRQERTACGILYGYSNGTVIEGNGTIACKTQDVACSIASIMSGQGESYSFTDGSSTGSQGTSFDNSALFLLPRPDQFGQAVDFGFLSGVDMTLFAPEGMFTDPDCEWSIVLYEYDTGLLQTIASVITGQGSTITSTFSNGVASPPLPYLTIDPGDNSIDLLSGRFYHSIYFYKNVQLDPSVSQDLSFVSSGEYDDYAGMPFTTMSGASMFKKPIKVKVNIDSIRMVPICENGVEAVGFIISFSYAQVRPSTGFA